MVSSKRKDNGSLNGPTPVGWLPDRAQVHFTPGQKLVETWVADGDYVGPRSSGIHSNVSHPMHWMDVIGHTCETRGPGAHALICSNLP